MLLRSNRNSIATKESSNTGNNHRGKIVVRKLRKNNVVGKIVKNNKKVIKTKTKNNFLLNKTNIAGKTIIQPQYNTIRRTSPNNTTTTTTTPKHNNNTNTTRIHTHIHTHTYAYTYTYTHTYINPSTLPSTWL